MFFHQFLMTSFLADSFFRQNKNPLCIADRRKPVGDNKCRTVLCQFLKGLLNDLFALIVQCRCRLIKNQNRRIFQKHSGDRKPLLLPSGKIYSTLADIRIVPLRKSHDKFMGIGIFGRLNDLFSGRLHFPYRMLSSTVPANR